MAGYMSKLQGYVYEGELTNGTGAPVENGLLVTIKADGASFKLPAADTTTKLICKEVGTIYDGIPAYRFIVEKLNANYYFVENAFVDYCDACAYDNRTYAVKEDKLMRAHPLVVGEEFWTDKVTGTPTVGNAYGVKADGTIG